MDARVILENSTANQISTWHKILLWMQANPSALHNTNISAMGKRACNGVDSPLRGTQTTTFSSAITRMLNQGLIMRSAGIRHANFAINYFHPNIPFDVAENAPEEIKEKVEEMRKGLVPGQYIDDNGCIVTLGSSQPSNAKQVETEEAEKEAEEEAEKVEPLPEPVETSTTAEVSFDGQGLTINITLNINLKNDKEKK